MEDFGGDSIVLQSNLGTQFLHASMLNGSNVNNFMPQGKEDTAKMLVTLAIYSNPVFNYLLNTPC